MNNRQRDKNAACSPPALRNRDTIDPMASAAAVVLPTAGFITRDKIPCWGSRMRPAEPRAASCEITYLRHCWCWKGTELYRFTGWRQDGDEALQGCWVERLACVFFVETLRFCRARETSTKEFNLAQKPEPSASAVSSFCGPQQQRAAGHDPRSVGTTKALISSKTLQYTQRTQGRQRHPVCRRWGPASPAGQMAQTNDTCMMKECFYFCSDEWSRLMATKQKDFLGC